MNIIQHIKELIFGKRKAEPKTITQHFNSMCKYKNECGSECEVCKACGSGVGDCDINCDACFMCWTLKDAAAISGKKESNLKRNDFVD